MTSKRWSQKLYHAVKKFVVIVCKKGEEMKRKRALGCFKCSSLVRRLTVSRPTKHTTNEMISNHIGGKIVVCISCI